MKRTIICAALSVALAAMPMTAFARDHYRHGGGYHRGGGNSHGGYHRGGGYSHGGYSHGGYYRGGGHYYHGGGSGFGLALPLIAGVAVLGAVADAVATPRYVGAPAPVYYSSPPVYNYAPAPAPYGNAPPPVYGYAPPVCTIYPNGATYCR